MMGDAISHAVLPGLAIAFLVTGSRDSVTMFIGAAIVGVLTAVFTQSIHYLGKVEESAAMGVVFTTLFALGLILIVRAADAVDLDPGCVLYGAIELVPLDTKSVLGYEIPRAALTTGLVAIINILFVVIFYKELKLTSFDPALATTLGINSQLMHYLLMTAVAVTAVAAFECVGSILVIAMMIVPAASAHLLTDRLHTMILVSVILGSASAVLGHVAAITVPKIWGFEDTNTAGMIAVVSGVIFFITMLAAPRHGVISKVLHQFILSVRIAREDILGLVYRFEEMGVMDNVHEVKRLMKQLTGTGPLLYATAVASLRHDGKIRLVDQGFQLSAPGKKAANSVIRSHRLWESYLHRYLKYPVEHLHFSAERLEHVTDDSMRERLATRTDSPTVDPHGKTIPEEISNGGRK